MESYVGCLVSVDCGAEGVFQGRIETFDEELGSLLLRKPFKDGKPFPKPSHTIKAGDIRDLSVIELAASTTQASAPKRIDKTRRSFTPPPMPSSRHTPVKAPPKAAQAPRPKPSGVQFQPPQAAVNPADAGPSGSRRRAKSTSGMKNCAEFEAELFGLLEGRKVQVKGRAAKDSHLLEKLDSQAMAEDFDFEGNLALFDKKTVMASIDGSGDAGPSAKLGPARDDLNYRHDQNVIQDSRRVTSWLSKGQEPFAVRTSSALDSSSDSLAPNPCFGDAETAEAARKTWLGPKGEPVGVQSWEEKVAATRQAFLGPCGVAASVASAFRFAVRRRVVDGKLLLKGKAGRVVLGLGSGELCSALVGSVALSLAQDAEEAGSQLTAVFPPSKAALPSLGAGVRSVYRAGKAGLPKVREVEALVLVGASDGTGEGEAWSKDPLLGEWVRAASGTAALVVLVETGEAETPRPLPAGALRLFLNAPSQGPPGDKAAAHTALLHSPFLPTSAATAALFAARPFAFLH